MGWAAYHCALLLGYGGGPLLPVQITNVFIGALGAALVWFLLRTVTRDFIVASAGCGILAFSYGYWWYSVEVEVYMLSVAFLICSLLIAHRAALRPKAGSFAALGATTGLAVLAHVTNVLFGAVAMVAVLYAARALPPRRLANCAAAYAGVVAGVVLPAYVLAIRVIGFSSPDEVLEWQTDYAQNDAWGGWGISALPKAVIGAGRSLTGGHFALSLDPARDLAYRVLPTQSLREEVFLVRDLGPASAVLLLLLVVAVLLMLAVLAAGWLRRPDLNGSARVLAVLCLSWLVPYAVFFTWWEPDNVEFWIAAWVPLAILLALPLSANGSPVSRGRASGVLLIVAVLFAVNLFGSVLPQHGLQNDYWRLRYSWYENSAKPSDMVVANDYIGASYLDYFSRAEVIYTGSLSEPEDLGDELQRHIRTSRAQRVLFSGDAFFPAADTFSRCVNGICERASAAREEFLPRTHVVSDLPLEKVRELELDRSDHMDPEEARR